MEIGFIIIFLVMGNLEGKLYSHRHFVAYRDLTRNVILCQFVSYTDLTREVAMRLRQVLKIALEARNLTLVFTALP